jgi:hypothetical protein
MPDWKKLIRERLAPCRLPSADREEVFSELAAHLEETYQDARSRGLNHAAAVELTLQEVKNWRVLATNICRAKSQEDLMNYRTKSLWLPAFANVIIAAALLTALEILGVKPRILWVSHIAMALPFPWLFALPVSGAAAALLAKRAQAPVAVRLIAGLAPSLIALAVFCVMPLVFVLDRWEFSGFPLPLDYFILSAVVWIVLPAFPLLVGTLPFLRESGLRKA